MDPAAPEEVDDLAELRKQARGIKRTESRLDERREERNRQIVRAARRLKNPVARLRRPKDRRHPHVFRYTHAEIAKAAGVTEGYVRRLLREAAE